MASFDEITVLASAARTALVTVQSNKIPRGAKIAAFILNVTVDPASASITPTFQVYNATSASWVDVLVSAAITGVGTYAYIIGPYVTAAANTKAAFPLPYDGQIGVKMAVADTDSMTYSISLMFG